MRAGFTRRAVLLAAAASLLSGLVTGCVVNVTPATPPQGKIAFASSRSGNGLHIWVMNADGSDSHQLTSAGRIDLDPSWSPDGKKIVFSSARDGYPHIYVINADGSGETRLTDGPGNNDASSWSPDGSRILFTSTRDGAQELYVMNADGTGQRRLTYDGRGGRGQWSPDGTHILYDARVGDDWRSEGIFLMRADGTERADILAIEGEHNIWASYSPDGSKILFRSNRGLHASSLLALYVMDADGSNQVRIFGAAGSPSWSPDGRRIVFTVLQGEGDTHLSEIYTMNADGSDVVQLTFAGGMNVSPVWTR